MERTADVPAADRLSSKSLFRKSVDQITLRLEDGSEPPKKEIPHRLLLIVALELFRGFRICTPASSEHLLGPSFSNFGPRPAAMIWRGGLPGTGSGIRERCARLELCFVASWSDARLMHLELACSDSAVSRLSQGCAWDVICWGGACWSVLVFPPARPVIAGRGAVFCQQQLMFFVSRRADASLEPGSSSPHREEKESRARVLGYSCPLAGRAYVFAGAR